MINSAYPFQLAASLFFSVPNTSDANAEKETCKTSIDALAQAVRSGNEDAIELLINFASGADHLDIRQLAEQSLIDLYMDSTVSDHTKSQIEAQALVFHEVTEKANAAQQENSEFVPHEISVPILYLAGQRAHSLGYKDTEAKINERLHGQIYGANAGALPVDNLVNRGRSVSLEELINCSPQLSNLKPHTTYLNLDNEESFNDQLGKMTAGLDGTVPATAFVLTHGHWLPLILQQASDGKVNCYVVDSNFQEGSQLSENTRTKLTTALNGKMDEFHFIGASMQKNTPNACAPLAQRLLSYINKEVGERGANLDMKSAIETSVNNWFQLNETQQNAIVTGMRSQFLSATARVTNGIG